MLWCQGAQNIGISHLKLKSVPTCTVWSQCTPVPDRRTDGPTDRRTGNIMAIARRFVLLTHRVLMRWNHRQRVNDRPLKQRTDTNCFSSWTRICTAQKDANSKFGTEEKLFSTQDPKLEQSARNSCQGRDFNTSKSKLDWCIETLQQSDTTSSQVEVCQLRNKTKQLTRRRVTWTWHK